MALLTALLRAIGIDPSHTRAHKWAPPAQSIGRDHSLAPTAAQPPIPPATPDAVRETSHASCHADDLMAEEAGRAFLIEYAGSHGETGERLIHLISLYRLGDRLFLKAWCDVSRRERPFRADRIGKLMTASGQVIAAPVKYLERMAPKNLAEPQSHKRTMTKAMPGLKSLLWIAGVDRELDAADEAILLSYIDRRITLGKGKHDHSWSRDLALARIHETTPTRGECLSVLKRISNSREVSLLKDHAIQIVSSSGAIDETKDDRRRQLMKSIR